MENEYLEAITFAQSEIGSMVNALGDGFKYIVPIGLGIIALVMGVFWLLGRARKFASSAR